jgi:hypothetical protein
MATTVTLMDTPIPDHCQSCGDTSDGLMRVRRLYVMTPEPDAPPDDAGSIRDGEPGTDVVVTPGSEELWCEVCRIHYPHELPADPG